MEAATDLVMKADLPSSVEVEALLVNEGDYVTEGTPIFRIAAEDAEILIDTYQMPHPGGGIIRKRSEQGGFHKGKL